MPAYNYAGWVAGAIDSVLAQDYPAGRLELIVVDDGSTDDTPAVLASFGDRIRTVRRPNGGLNAATTTGIEHATGDLLTFIDADDLWPADRTRLLVDALQANPWAGIAFGDMEIIDARGETLYPSFRQSIFLSARAEHAFGRLVASNFISAGSMMVRAALRDRFHPIPDFAPYQDWWMALRVAEVAGVVSIDGVVNRYRHHAENMNLGAQEDRLLGLRLKELPFRRWLVANLTAEGRTPEQQLAALSAYDMVVRRVAAAQDETIAAAHPTSEEERERAAGLRRTGADAAGRGDDAAAIEALVRAAVLEPAAERGALHAAMARLRGDGRVPSCRSFAGFVHIDHVTDYPGIVRRWAEQFDGASDSSLVIGGVTTPGDVDFIVDVVTRLGINDEDGADIVTLPESDAAAAALRLGRPMDLVITPPTADPAPAAAAAP